MHEQALMRDVMRKIEEVARSGRATRVTGISVRLGSLSHFTPEHFREHFEDASRGTIAEGADVHAVVDGDITDELARDVVLDSVEVEVPAEVPAERSAVR
jgi:hydrogenase nickel incorporation protein HypA/HybF